MNATKATLTTLTNSFHGTEYRTRKTREEMDAVADRVHLGTADEADRAFYREVRRALCGIEGCKCGMTEYNER